MRTDTESFAESLRQARIRLQKTMGQVARELGITIVYYSEVEAGKKPAFPEKKVSYFTLAKILETSEQNLKSIAQLDREKRNMQKAFSCRPEQAQLAVSFGRRLSNNDLSEKQILKIQNILNEGQ